LSLTARRAEALGAHLPPLLVAAERVASTVAQGVHGRRRVGQGDSFWQFRQFFPGDAINRIDWRISARSNRIYVRETEWEAAQTVCLWCDTGASMRWKSRAAPAHKADRATLIALALAALLLRGGERVLPIALGARPFAGRAGLDRLAEALARQPDHDGVPPETRLLRYARVVLIGDLLAPLPQLATKIAQLAAVPLRGVVLQVLDPAEVQLPYEGRVRFQGLRDEPAPLIPRVEGVRTQYAERLANQQRGIAAICAAAGWTSLVHHTDQPPEAALLALYGALAPPKGRR